jgi:hypothetical protein
VARVWAFARVVVRLVAADVRLLARVAAPFLAVVERFVAAALRAVARVSALTVFVVSVASEAMSVSSPVGRY